jgi:hypothetical protein
LKLVKSAKELDRSLTTHRNLTYHYHVGQWSITKINVIFFALIMDVFEYGEFGTTKECYRGQWKFMYTWGPKSSHYHVGQWIHVNINVVFLH